MADFWSDWWAKAEGKLQKNRHILEKECEKRGANVDVVMSNGLGWLDEEDWPTLLAGFPGLEKWRFVLQMPVYSMVVDGEFGWEGIVMREMGKKEYVSPRHRDAKLGPFSLGLTKCVESVWKDGWVIVVEGMWDYLALRHYTPNVVAVLTDNVSPALAITLARYAVVCGMMMDNDEMGMLGTRKTKLRLEKAGITPYQIPYRGKDPGEAQKQGFQQFGKAVKDAISQMEWLVQTSR